MTIDRADISSSQSTPGSRLAHTVLWLVAAGILSYVALLVDERTIAIASARRLLARWDLATHLGHGWMDYHLLVTGQIPRLLWDPWLQGYWPPVLSIYQVPFYVVLGGGMASGLRSTLVAFVLIGLTDVAMMWRQWRDLRHAAHQSLSGAARLVPEPARLCIGDDDRDAGCPGF